jgi:hypothetical protein
MKGNEVVAKIGPAHESITLTASQQKHELDLHPKCFLNQLMDTEKELK